MSNISLMNKSIYISKILILILIFWQTYHNINLKKKANIFYNDEKPLKMGNYSFFNSFNSTLITIILYLPKSNLNNISIEDYVFIFLQQTLKNIEIIIYCYYKDSCNTSLLNKISSENKNIYIYKSKRRNKILNIFNIVNIIKGQFLIIIDKIINFHNDELYYFFNFTKGKIDNIFKFKTRYNFIINLIRTKVLHDIEDIDKNFYNYNGLINYLESFPNPIIKYIPISLSPNDKYLPLAYTSMLSILYSKNYYSYIDFYLIIPKEFSYKNYILLDSLFEQFYFFNITYIYMDNRYEKAFVHRYITNQAYYRFSLGCLLPRLNKIIYLDADTICFSDLSKLYDLNFKGKMMLGKGLNRNKTNLKQIHINSGILLLNLKIMRKLKIENKVLKILNSGFKHPTLHDQAVIDTFLYKYVGLFPPEFNAYMLNSSETFNLISKMKLYDKDKVLFSIKYPIIRHYKGDKKELNDDWFFFARQSKYFHEKDNNYSIVYNFSL